VEFAVFSSLAADIGVLVLGNSSEHTSARFEWKMLTMSAGIETLRRLEAQIRAFDL
jgi:hypothetical protein